MPTMSPRFLRPEAYAEACGVSIHTLRYWIRSRVIPIYRVGRAILIDPVEADRALKQIKQEAVSVK
jgi:excisionase family DNA binding protein